MRFLLLLLLLFVVVPLRAVASLTAACTSGVTSAIYARAFSEWANQPVPALSLPSVRFDLPILVIGAGPAGLPVMKELSDAGLPWEAAERQAEVGGVWNPDNPLSPAYLSLRTNSSKSTTHLGDPVPADWPEYMTKDHAGLYLRQYADRHGLRPQIHFRTEITTIRENPDGSWRVTMGAPGSPGVERDFRAVVLATGFHDKNSRYFPQELWDQATRSGIHCIHGSDYRNNDPYRDLRTLVMGSGNTGAEIATEVSRVAKETILSVRTSPWLVPEYVFGIPADKFAKASPPRWLVPHWLEMKIFHLIQRYYVGHPESLGFPKLDHDLLERLPVADRGIARALRSGKITISPTVERFESGKAYFTDGTAKPIDSVVFATGYRTRYPFMPERWQEPNDGLSFWMFAPDAPNLVYMQEVGVPQGVWPVFAAQAKFAAAYFVAQAKSTPNCRRYLSLRSMPNPDFKGEIFLKDKPRFVDPKIYGESHLPAITDWIGR